MKSSSAAEIALIIEDYCRLSTTRNALRMVVSLSLRSPHPWPVEPLPVAVANPAHARNFARAVGRLAKTDSINAMLLAHFAEAIRPAIRALPNQGVQDLSDVITRRQLVELLMAERNRSLTLYGWARKVIMSPHVIFLLFASRGFLLLLTGSDVIYEFKNENWSGAADARSSGSTG